MMNREAADRAADLARHAMTVAGDAKRGCFELIAAAMASQEMLRGQMPSAKVEDLLNLLAVAAAVLLDDDCAGLLDLAEPQGSA